MRHNLRPASSSCDRGKGMICFLSSKKALLTFATSLAAARIDHKIGLFKNPEVKSRPEPE
jgi:hypothetical protein